MAYYRQVGAVPRQRHTQFRDESGALLYEELMGEEGFSSDSSLLYHRGVPSALSAAEPWQLPDHGTRPNHPLQPRHLKVHDLFPGSAEEAGRDVDAVTGRRVLLANADVRLAYVVTATTSPYYRNATGDECVFVEEGDGVVETGFGVVPYRSGDYVVLPRATTHRWVPGSPSRLYVVEAAGHISPPKRYLSRFGQLLEHAPYCERDLHGPTEPLVHDGPAGPRAPTSRCWSSTGATCRAVCSAPAWSTPPTRSTWSAGTAASTRTR